MKDFLYYGALTLCYLFFFGAILSHRAIRYRRDDDSTPWPFTRRFSEDLKDAWMPVFMYGFFFLFGGALLFAYRCIRYDFDHAHDAIFHELPFLLIMMSVGVLQQILANLENDKQDSESFEELSLRRIERIERAIELLWKERHLRSHDKGEND